MRLDIRTIIVIIIIGNLLISAGMFSVSRGYLGQIRGVSQWAAATLIQSLGWIVFGPLRLVMPETISILLGNGLILFSLSFYLMILAEFIGKQIPHYLLHAKLVIVIAALAYFSLIDPNLLARNIIISNYMAIVMLSGTYLLIRQTERYASHTFTACILALCGIAMLIRVIYFIYLAPDPAPYALNNSINDLSGVALYLFGIMFTFGFILMCNDRYISQQKLAEDARIVALKKHQQLEETIKTNYETLTVTEHRLRRLMNSSLIGIVQGDASGQLKEANDVLLQLIQYPRQALIDGHINWFELLPATALLQQKQMQKEIAHPDVMPPFECQIQARDGSLIPIMLSLSQLEGTENEWVSFVVDLREQRRIDTMKSEFISVVSHELRTPLTSIKGSLGLLEGGVVGVLPSQALHLIKIAHKNSLRLVNLVNNILDMEKITSGKLGLNLQLVDLVHLAKQAVETNAGYAEQCQVRYQMTTSTEQALVMGDIDRLMQVFANLLSNAAKFSPSGDEVSLRIIDQAPFWRVEIEDHGSGIPADFHDRIFGKFAQADGSNTRQVEGAGLGLHITKSLIENMGGDIGFRSEKDVATVFWFTLPASK